MIKLTECPIVFVHYPQGAGGWFLASLIQHTFDSCEEIRIDKVGSGHSNVRIEKLNNFYNTFLESEQGKQIIRMEYTENFTRKDQIKYLQNTLVINENISTDVVQTISLHCKDVNIFLEAFPNSKCIQILVPDNELIKCAINYLYKIVTTRPIAFTNFAKLMNRSDQQIAEDMKHFNNPSPVWLQQFEWIVSFILRTHKSVDNNPKFDNRILEITMTEYLTDPVESVLEAVLSFLKSVNYFTDAKLHDQVCGSLLQYRAQQLRILFD